MPRRDELTVLLRSARELAKLWQQGAALVAEAREHHADQAVMAAARQMASDVQRSKHAAEDVLVAFVLDCSRCGRRVHWVPGEGCELGHWAHAEPAPNDHAPRLRPDD
jgi:hypothetical protein